MKNKILKIISVLFAFVMCGGSVVSYAIEFIPEGEKYIIQGNAGEVLSNMLSFDVSGGGEKVHLSYIITNDDGDFHYSFMLPEGTEPGKYTARVTDADNGEIFNYDFMHADDEKKAQLIDALNTANDIESAQLAFNECVAFSMYSYPTVFSLSEDAMNEIYDKIAEASGFDAENYVDKLGELFAVVSLKYAEPTDVDKVLDEYRQYYSFEKEKYYDLYSDFGNVSAVNQMFLKNEFDDIEQIRTVFNEIVVLYRIFNEESPGDIVEVIKDFQNVFPKSVTVLSDNEKLKLGTNILGKQINSMKELETEVDLLLKENEDDDDDRTSSGGGRGSSKISGYSAGVASLITSENIEKSENPTPKTDFADMRDAEWAREAVYILSDKKILNGYTDGDFKPNNMISREEFVKIIVCAFDFQTEQAESEFSDVPDGHWAEEYICAAQKNGMINGIGNNEFGLGENITRQDMAVIIYNVLLRAGITVEIESDVIFSDMNNADGYSTAAIKALKASGITNGYTDGSFRPQSTASRAEAAQLIYNVLMYSGRI